MEELIDQETKDFYKNSLTLIKENNIPFLLGGAFALREYTGVIRYTKDLDIFCTKEDNLKILKLFDKKGFQTEQTSTLWISKIFKKDAYIDVIFNSGNGISPVDKEWFKRTTKKKVLGMELEIIPAEEMFWQKAFIQTRTRFDGADINHLILKRGEKLDWKHIYNRFEDSWEILLQNLLAFRYTYPSEKDIIPKWLLKKLLDRLKDDLSTSPIDQKITRGPLLSPGNDLENPDYGIDFNKWGFINVKPRK